MDDKPKVAWSKVVLGACGMGLGLIVLTTALKPEPKPVVEAPAPVFTQADADEIKLKLSSWQYFAYTDDVTGFLVQGAKVEDVNGSGVKLAVRGKDVYLSGDGFSYQYIGGTVQTARIEYDNGDRKLKRYVWNLGRDNTSLFVESTASLRHDLKGAKSLVMHVELVSGKTATVEFNVSNLDWNKVR